MASVPDSVLAMEEGAIATTRALLTALNEATVRYVSTENLPTLISGYEALIEAFTANSMLEFPED